MDKLHESGYHENVVHLNNNYDDGKLGAMCMSDHDNDIWLRCMVTILAQKFAGERVKSDVKKTVIVYS